MSTISQFPASLARAAIRAGGRWSLALALAVAASATPARSATAQGILGRLKQKVKEKAAAATDTIGDMVVDRATGAVICAATNTNCIKEAADAGKPVQIVDSQGNKVSAGDSAAAVASAGTSAPGKGGAGGLEGDVVLVNYDFVPGDRVLFSEDFTSDNIGDFPRRLNLVEGNFDVAEVGGQRFLRATADGGVSLELPEVLPERFTFEADFRDARGVDVFFVHPDSAGEDIANATFTSHDGGIINGGVSSHSEIPSEASQPLTHIAVMADNLYVKAYVNGVRVANAPRAKLGRSRTVVLRVFASTDEPGYLTNIRVAAGGKPLYDALMASGRVSTHGILFSTGSDRIRSESKPTLDQIGRMLRSHAELRLTIEGHTDNVGSAASNQTLSEKRAAAVRDYLISAYKVDGARLTSKGFGATKPVASNDTPEGRQQNRRVELVKN